MRKAYTHALWIYGVVVGLAIREALTHIMAHTFPAGSSFSNTHTETALEALRTVVFLTIIVRFYFGSIQYFEKMYAWEDPVQPAPPLTPPQIQSFGIDFLVGLVHFLIFFGWSYSITMHERVAGDVSWFMVVLSLVMGYDLLWLALSLHYDTRKQISFWTLINLFTLILSICAFLLAERVHATPAISEAICYIPVLFMSIVDFGEMISGRNRFTEWLRKALDKGQTERKS